MTDRDVPRSVPAVVTDPPPDLSGRRCLVTGGRGWLGRFLVEALLGAGARVTVLDIDISRPMPHGVVLVKADLVAGPPEIGVATFDHVFHLAGLAHRVPRTRAEAKMFFRVNRDGTVHLLQALAERPPRSVVLVSSVAVYGRESGEGITEDHPRRATDPYGRSKAEAEDRLREWADAHGTRAVVVRPPLVAGPDAPGNLGSMVAALRRGRYFRIGRGEARRSLVRADDLCAGLAALALAGEGAYHLTDGHHPSFRELEDALAEALGRGPVRSLPAGPVRAVARAGDLLERLLRRDLPLDSRRLGKLTSTLTFDDTRARHAIGWRPRPVLAAGSWLVAPPDPL